MTRFMVSSCGVLAEVTHIALAQEVAVVMLAALGLSWTLREWCGDLLHVADRIIGNDRVAGEAAAVAETAEIGN
jgi:hypothetical protein